MICREGENYQFRRFIEAKTVRIFHHNKRRGSRLLEYGCWALAVLCVAPAAMVWGARLLYVDVAEDKVQAYLEGATQSVALHSEAAGAIGSQAVIAEQDQSLWAKGRRAAFQRLTAHGELVMAAVLSIPRLNSTIPVFNGTTETAMTLGAEHLSDTVALTGEGNIALSSHRDGAFRVLKDVEKDDA